MKPTRIKPALLILISFLALTLIVPGAMAQNVSFSTLEQLGSQDILIYTYNGTSQLLYGQWNTTSLDVPLPDDDFNIIVRPSAAARFSNPNTLLEDGFTFVETYFFQLLAFAVILGIIWKRK